MSVSTEVKVRPKFVDARAKHVVGVVDISGPARVTSVYEAVKRCGMELPSTSTTKYIGEVIVVVQDDGSSSSSGSTTAVASAIVDSCDENEDGRTIRRSPP